jgi:hypothetical protein
MWQVEYMVFEMKEKACTYKVAMGHIWVAVVALEKQYVLNISVFL